MEKCMFLWKVIESFKMKMGIDFCVFFWVNEYFILKKKKKRKQ